VILATGCEQLTIDNLKIDSNRDGIDLDSCRQVTISNCQVNTPNDDAIVLKSSYSLGESRPCEDVTIRNCRLSGYDMGTMLDGTFGTTQKLAPDRGGPTGRIKLGTESNAGFRNVTITDCIFEHSRGLALEVVDGGVLEDITVSGLTMRDITSAPLFIRLGNRARGPAGSPVATARRISITNVVATDVEPRYATLISGIPGHFIEDVHLGDIQIQYRGGGGKLDAKVQPAEKENGYPEPNMFGVIPAYGLYCRHVKNLRVENVSFYFMKPDQRPAVILKNVHNGFFTNLMASRLPGVPGMVLHHVSRITVDDSPPIANQHIERADHRNLA
jgi:polygalacturonase